MTIYPTIHLVKIPTFHSTLCFSSGGGLGDNIHTQSLISGLWSCAYSFGEVIGPISGGALLEHFSFPVTSSVMAVVNFATALVTAIYFLTRKTVAEPLQSVNEKVDPNENGKFTSSIEDFGVFTVETERTKNGVVSLAYGERIGNDE